MGLFYTEEDRKILDDATKQIKAQALAEHLIDISDRMFFIGFDASHVAKTLDRRFTSSKDFSVEAAYEIEDECKRAMRKIKQASEFYGPAKMHSSKKILEQAGELLRDAINAMKDARFKAAEDYATEALSLLQPEREEKPQIFNVNIKNEGIIQRSFNTNGALQQSAGMGTLADYVKQLAALGMSEGEIIRKLKDEGYRFRELDHALHVAMGGLVELIKACIANGESEADIIKYLKDKGYSYSEIDEALNSAQL